MAKPKPDPNKITRRVDLRLAHKFDERLAVICLTYEMSPTQALRWLISRECARIEAGRLYAE